MGAGKTYLMAAFIYLDSHFARLHPGDPRFARNFVVFAPQASKTAILPSLQTIRNFDPAWVPPPNDAAAFTPSAFPPAPILKANNIKVDLVYIDPPFASGVNFAKKIFLRNGGESELEGSNPISSLLK